MSDLFDEMLKNYDTTTMTNRKNALKEVIQEIVLCGLSRAGFFSDVAFYGGTALRIFHGLDRFSEDLDFSLLHTDNRFDLSEYLPILENEMHSFGLVIEVSEKQKSTASDIQSAFVKANTKQQLSFFFEDQNSSSIHPDEKIRIRFEVDTNPPDFAGFEHRYRLLPYPYEVQLYDRPSLLAGKIHAVLARSWKSRVKGRDLYDFVFYLQHNTPVNLRHLKARLIQTGHLKTSDTFNIEDLRERLIEHFDQLDYENAKQDVIPFIKDTRVLEIWSSNFFKDITTNLLVYNY
ncbi:MAG: nucleotidyl transferase AbiEii/AbiGii toxin family protein [Anaerolineaceae bacterium]|jgi:predicted nucleotidyltransferase component of viral defense system|nr:nucleotidyl transferase AbiEii/AbiGii toxin family protein [Anaerolineaceae bacterium]